MATALARLTGPPRPLSDAQLDDKFAQLVEPVLGAERVKKIGDACRRLADVANIRDVVALCCP